MSRGRFERKKEKPKAGKTIIIVIAVILALVLIAAVAGIYYYNSMLNKMDHVEVPKIQYTTAPTETQIVEETTSATETVETEPKETEHVPSSEDYINFLIVGQAARYGDAERMADTMMLVTFNTYEKSITLTSILRDSFVKPPDYMGKKFGRIKLNTVYHLGSHYEGSPAGSMELINMTLYNNFGIEVDHNFEVDFEAFIKIVDMLGGVVVELTQEEAKLYPDGDCAIGLRDDGSEFKLIPYYRWCRRENSGRMQVWFRQENMRDTDNPTDALYLDYENNVKMN